MALYRHSGVSVESWVELEPTVPMRCEIDRDNGVATLIFGAAGEYTLVLRRGNLEQLLSLGNGAMADLDSPATGEIPIG